MTILTVGIDLAKNVFAVHGVKDLLAGLLGQRVKAERDLIHDNRFGPARGVTDELKGGARLAG